MVYNLILQRCFHRYSNEYAIYHNDGRRDTSLKYTCIYFSLTDYFDYLSEWYFFWVIINCTSIYMLSIQKWQGVARSNPHHAVGFVFAHFALLVDVLHITRS